MNCSKKGCTHAASLYPVLTFLPQGFPHAERAQMGMELPLCEEHALPEVDLYMNDAGFDQLCAIMNSKGIRAPDRESIEVEFRKIPDQDFHMRFEAPNQ